ncbi:MAG: TGS domain-containing protein, partial [Actinomycetota bacterium]|nr:TGS domain-containing protein [Actinomycetota bacterium]
MADLTITLPDGTTRSVPAGTTVGGLAAHIGRGLAKAAVIGSVDGIERDLDWELADGATVEIVTATSDRGLSTIRHSTTHVMAQAVLELFPGATFAIGPPVENGFYYDFELPPAADGKPSTFVPEDLERIEVRMREILAQAQPFVRDELSTEMAR